MRITRHRAIAAATAAAIALSSMAITPASAGPYRHYHRGAGNAAVLGAVAGVFGLIATLAARRHYEREYGYGGYGRLRSAAGSVRLLRRARVRTTATERLPKPPSEAAFLPTAGAADRGASFFAPQQRC